MENYRSMSCREGRLQMENNENNNHGGRKLGGEAPTNMEDLRSYSTSYASNYMQVHPQPWNKGNINNNQNQNQKKNRASGNRNGNGNGNGNCSAASTKGWSLSDPELQRKKRVASYKVYGVEGKLKGSFRKSFRWVKNTCSHVVHGWW